MGRVDTQYNLTRSILVCKSIVLRVSGGSLIVLLQMSGEGLKCKLIQIVDIVVESPVFNLAEMNSVTTIPFKYIDSGGVGRGQREANRNPPILRYNSYFGKSLRWIMTQSILFVLNFIILRWERVKNKMRLVLVHLFLVSRSGLVVLPMIFEMEVWDEKVFGQCWTCSGIK